LVKVGVHFGIESAEAVNGFIFLWEGLSTHGGHNEALPTMPDANETESILQIFYRLPDIFRGTFIKFGIIYLAMYKLLPGCEILEKAETLTRVGAGFLIDLIGDLCPLLPDGILISRRIFLFLINDGVFTEGPGKLSHFVLDLVRQLRFGYLTIDKAFISRHAFPGTDFHTLLLLMFLTESLIGMNDAFFLALHIEVPPLFGKKIPLESTKIFLILS
jgi:hypothetical protein